MLPNSTFNFPRDPSFFFHPSFSRTLFLRKQKPKYQETVKAFRKARRAGSSVGMNAWLALKRSGVQIPPGPLQHRHHWFPVYYRFFVTGHYLRFLKILFPLKSHTYSNPASTSLQASSSGVSNGGCELVIFETYELRVKHGAVQRFVTRIWQDILKVSVTKRLSHIWSLFTGHWLGK